MKKIIFWVLSLTWGLPMTLIGLIAGAVLISAGYSPTKYGYGMYFVYGTGYGGVSFGPIAVISTSNDAAGAHTRQHEMGHSFQNVRWGPLFIFVIGIPSLIRCAYYNYCAKHDRTRYAKLPAYDSIWFEGQATRLGEAFSKKHLNNF